MNGRATEQILIWGRGAYLGRKGVFRNKSPYAFGSGDLEDLMSGIATGARTGYIATWKRRYQFTQFPTVRDG